MPQPAQPQPADLFFTTTRTEKVSVVLGFALYSLEIFAAAKNIPGAVKMVLRPKNPDGSWNMEVEPRGFHFEDDLFADADDPAKYKASLVQQLILTGEATTASVLAVQFGLVGMDMVKCSQVLTPALTGIPNENPELVPETPEPDETPEPGGETNDDQ